MGVKELGRRFFRRARRDERGGILVTAALAMLPITMLCFASVEFHNFTRQRSALQDALDSASIAVARAPASTTETELRTLYIAVLKSHLALKPGLLTLVEAPANPDTGAAAQPQLTYVDGRVTASATVKVSPIIANFFFGGDILVRGAAQVVREVRGVEVALVLDTTGSMEENNRIGIAKEAATNFVNLIGAAASASNNPDSVRISVVPFANTVNVGATNQSAAWMDGNGASPIHNEIFSDARGGAVSANRFNLLGQMQISWAGCVESRPMPHDIQDTAPTSGTPATLFVPYFAPDIIDWVPYVQRPKSPNAAYVNRWTTDLDRRFHDMRNADFVGTSTPDATAMLQAYRLSNDYLPDVEPAVQTYNSKKDILGGYWPGFSPPNKDRNGYTDYENFVTAFMSYMGVTDFNVSALTLLGNNAATKITAKYTKANIDAEVAASRFDRASLDEGPNAGCKVKPITRLTSTMSTVTTAINAMTTGGGTNIPMGLMWGWHTLSPNTPFADGAAYGTAGNTKVIILMTDGANDTGSIYSGVGFPWQKRLGNTADGAAVSSALNGRLATLCDNVKARNIVLYTIRVEMTGDNTLLQTCATDATKAYDVKQASDLDSTFREIARSIQRLRIES